jgi:hypothetical protein
MAETLPKYIWSGLDILGEDSPSIHLLFTKQLEETSRRFIHDSQGRAGYQSNGNSEMGHYKGNLGI